MKLSEKWNYELSSHIYQVISYLVCGIISFDNFFWGFISLGNEHGVMQLLAPDVLGISKKNGQLVNNLL